MSEVTLTQIKNGKQKGKWVIVGPCSWAKVFEPDTKFVAEGVYSIDIELTEEEADMVREKLRPLAEEEFERLAEDKPVLRKQGSIADFIRYRTDEDGEVVGYSVQIKQKAQVYSKKNDKTYDMKVTVLDGKGNKMDGSQLIGNGSKVAVVFDPASYYAPSSKTVGVTMRGLSHVKVLELVEYAAGVEDPLADLQGDFEASNTGTPESSSQDEPTDDFGEDFDDNDVF